MPNPTFLVRLLMRFALLEMRCSCSPTAFQPRLLKVFGAVGNGQDQLRMYKNLVNHAVFSFASMVVLESGGKKPR